jgi:hypothetical protein
VVPSERAPQRKRSESHALPPDLFPSSLLSRAALRARKEGPFLFARHPCCLLAEEAWLTAPGLRRLPVTRSAQQRQTPSRTATEAGKR